MGQWKGAQSADIDPHMPPAWFAYPGRPAAYSQGKINEHRQGALAPPVGDRVGDIAARGDQCSAGNGPLIVEWARGRASVQWAVANEFTDIGYHPWLAGFDKLVGVHPTDVAFELRVSLAD